MHLIIAGTPQSRNCSYPAVLRRAGLKTESVGVVGRPGKKEPEQERNFVPIILSVLFPDEVADSFICLTCKFVS